MDVAAATMAGSAESPNEDDYLIRPTLLAVLDGLTARTETGCRHGVAWYTAHLSAQLATTALDLEASLSGALRQAIINVRELHPECDLENPATPAAAVGLVRTSGDLLEYLLLGDVHIVYDCAGDIGVVTDQRIDATARDQRSEADQYPIGSPRKQALLLTMKQAEIALRNEPGGYWIAASKPEAASHAIIGSLQLDGLRSVAIFSDGAARLVNPFRVMTWAAVLGLVEDGGPSIALEKLRASEASDPRGDRWPRNKVHDDATIVVGRWPR